MTFPTYQAGYNSVLGLGSAANYAAATFPQYPPTAYHDGISDTYTVTCVSGSPAVTLTVYGSNGTPAFVSGDVGKVINIAGCGATSGVLVSIIQSVAGAGSITLANNALTSEAAGAETVTYGHDDTAVLQAGLNSCNLILQPSVVYLATNLSNPSCALKDNNLQTGNAEHSGIFSPSVTTIRALYSADNNYLLASSNWINNILYDNAPWKCTNVIFDGANIKTYSVADTSFASFYDHCRGINAVSHGIRIALKTENGTDLLQGAGGSTQFSASEANGNGGDGIHMDDPNGGGFKVTDVQIRGGFIHNNGGWGIYAGVNAGHLLSGVHFYTNSGPVSDVNGNSLASNGDLFVAGLGFGDSIIGNDFEGSVQIDSLNTTSQIGSVEGNAIGGYLVSNFRSNSAGATFRSKGNRFYNSSNTGLWHGYNSANMTIISDGDVFQNALFGRLGQSGTIQAINDTSYAAANSSPGFACWINGSIPPTQAGAGLPCTDYDLTKTASSGATSLVFTVAATVLNYYGAPGPGFAVSANLDVTSQETGPVFELWQGLLLGGYARGYGTTAVQNDLAVVTSKDNSGSPAITVTPTFANTGINSSGANTVTYTITVAFPAALDSISTVAHLRLHADQHYVFAFSVQ